MRDAASKPHILIRQTCGFLIHDNLGHGCSERAVGTSAFGGAADIGSVTALTNSVEKLRLSVFAEIL